VRLGLDHEDLGILQMLGAREPTGRPSTALLRKLEKLQKATSISLLIVKGSNMMIKARNRHHGSSLDDFLKELSKKSSRGKFRRR
jgi:hypothetical protein